VTSNGPMKLQQIHRQLSACAFKCSLHESFNSVIISVAMFARLEKRGERMRPKIAGHMTEENQWFQRTGITCLVTCLCVYFQNERYFVYPCISLAYTHMQPSQCRAVKYTRLVLIVMCRAQHEMRWNVLGTFFSTFGKNKRFMSQGKIKDS
jgi:hypothetical protein